MKSSCKLLLHKIVQKREVGMFLCQTSVSIFLSMISASLFWEFSFFPLSFLPSSLCHCEISSFLLSASHLSSPKLPLGILHFTSVTVHMHLRRLKFTPRIFGCSQNRGVQEQPLTIFSKEIKKNSQRVPFCLLFWLCGFIVFIFLFI